MPTRYIGKTLDARADRTPVRLYLGTELATVDVLIIDDFALEPMSREESRDIYQLFSSATHASPMSWKV